MRDRRDIGHSFTGKHAFLCAMAGPLAGEQILDLGCGIGWFEDYALREGCMQVVGVDSDEVRLARAHAAAPDATFYFGHRHYKIADVSARLRGVGYRVVRVRYGGGMWEHLAMLWLYFFKWVLAREMPGTAFLEKRRRRDYRHPRALPVSASATMYVEATRAGAR